MPRSRKRRRGHPRLREISRRLAANRAPQLQPRRLGTLVAGAATGHQVPKREHRRSKKTREKTLTALLLRRGVGTQMTGTVFQPLTGAVIDLPRATDEMLTSSRHRGKGGIPGVIVVAAVIAIPGDHEADQLDQSVDAGQGAGPSGEMIGGGLAALRVIAVITTHLTEDRGHHAGGVLIEQIDVTRQGLLDGDGRDLTPV